MSQPACPICLTSPTRQVKRVRDSYHYLDGEWSLAECPRCGVAYLADPPDEQGIGAYYPAAAYYTHGAPPGDHPLMAAINDYHYGKRSDLLGRVLHGVLGKYINMFPRLQDGRPTRLLDFGCGNGGLMRRYAGYGFECEGFDVDSAALAQARKRGFVAYGGDWRSIPQASYDVVVMNQVLEHLHRPLEVLRFVRSRLVPGGQLIISVPNRECADYAILLDSWTSFQAPTHLYHYSLRALQQLMNQAGFAVDEVRYPSPLATLRPGYIKSNLNNLFRLDGRSVNTRLRAVRFLASSLMAMMPLLDAGKRIRVTLSCSLQANE